MKRKLLVLLFILNVCFGLAQYTAIPDPNFELALITQGIDSEGGPVDGQVLTVDIENIIFLNLTGVDTNDVTETFTAPGLGITNLNGIKSFTNLEVLWVQQNDLIELDLEGMTTLIDVRAFNNNLDRINIKGLINLDIIGLNNNSLSGVNLSTNNSLRQFDIAQNNLLYLDISNLSSLTEMNVQNNSLLACIQVESAARAASLNGNTDFRKNGTTTFSNTCTSIYTQIPDRNFEQRLIDLNIDTVGSIPDGLVLTADIADEITLDISGQEIDDLTGLEAFASIENLDVSDNDLNSLILQNVNLITIRANNCNLENKTVLFQNQTSGDFLTNVTLLELRENNWGSLGTPGFNGIPNVNVLDLSGNNLKGIRLEFTPNLTILRTSRNAGLDTLTDLNTLSTLQELSVDNCSLTLLQIDQLGDLSTLIAENNSLTSLNVSQNRSLAVLNTLNNTNLDCIQVADVSLAQAEANWQKDATTVYNTDCSSNTPFEVTTSLLGAGTGPNYEISEGETFSINFNAGNTATDGDIYSPTIEFSLNGNLATDDFRFNGNNSTIPNNPFTVSSANPDGNISVQAFDDGTTEGDEIYTITINSSDTSSYVMIEPTVFTITVKDAEVSNEVRQIGVHIFKDFIGDSNSQITSPYIFTESPNTSVAIAFDALDIDAAFFANYELEIKTRDGSALLEDDDYSLVDESFTITNNDEGYDFYESFRASVNIKNDTELNENNETFFIDITPRDNTISLVDYSSNVLGDVLDPGETLSLEIIIKNSKIYYGDELIIFDTELKGNFELNNDVYSVNEGEKLQLEFNAQTPNIADGFEFPIEFFISNQGATLNQDYELSTQNPILLTVDNTVAIDGFLEIDIKNDSFNDQDEFISIFLPGNQFNSGPFLFEDYNPDTEYPGKTFRIKINNVAQTSAVLVELNNTGGTEGNGIEIGREGATENGIGSDTFTLSLKNSDGSEYTTTEQLTFPISFSSDLSVSEDLRAEIIDYDQNDPIPSGNDINLTFPSEIVVPPGASSGSITIALPQEDEADNNHEFYLATVQAPNEGIAVSLPEPLQAKIIDDEGQFIVVLDLITEGLIERDDTGNCCPYFAVEEGTTLQFSFNAEKGVVDKKQYDVILEYGSADNPSDLPKALETDDFYTALGPSLDQRLQKEFQFNADNDFLNPDGNPDNILSIKIENIDENDEENERFKISFNPIDELKFRLTSSIYSDDFLIIETIPASIEASDDIADEEDAQNNKGLFTIRLAKPAKSQITVVYQIEGTAINGSDYLTIEDSVTFMEGEIEKTIEIEARPDDTPEKDKTIIITLKDGQGYSINQNNARDTVTIPQNDQDKVQFEVTLTSLDNQIFENPDEKNVGAFQVSITPPNTSGISLPINYSFIDDNELNPAKEGMGNDFTQDGTGTLIFESGGESTKTITVTALQDPEQGIEEAETITLLLKEGDRYSAGAKAKMEIISTEVDTSSLSSTALEVSVSTNTCANTYEGDVIIKNNSGFDIMASITTQNKSVKIERNKEESIKNLPSGRHLVTFTFVDDTIDLLPPSFEIFITELNGTNLLGKQVNLNSKTANLQVSGSRKYTVVNGNQEHYFEFNDFLEKSISIPISEGINDILIKGEAACQGIVKTKVFLNKFVVFPNPTEDIITLSGFLLEEEATVSITDLSGKSFLNTTKKIISESVQLDLSKYPTGLYFGNITTVSGQDLKFKILKK